MEGGISARPDHVANAEARRERGHPHLRRGLFLRPGLGRGRARYRRADARKPFRPEAAALARCRLRFDALPRGRLRRRRRRRRGRPLRRHARYVGPGRGAERADAELSRHAGYQLMAAAPYTVAQYLVDRLKQCGVGHVFAVPGDYASRFLDALDATEGITRVPNINELGSGYAADGYARFKGIGAACIQYGVGTFSALNCAAGAFVERVPVAFISASPSTKDRRLENEEAILFHHSTG